MKRHSVYNDQYFAFEGVPFAKPPLGELRFKAPQPLETWTDIKDCTNVRAKCIQPNLVLRKIQGSEDCLYLNIYTKNVSINLYPFNSFIQSPIHRYYILIYCYLILVYKTFIVATRKTTTGNGMDTWWCLPSR